MQVQRECAGLVPRPLQRAAYLVQPAREAVSTAPSRDGQHVLKLLHGTVEITTR